MIWAEKKKKEVRNDETREVVRNAPKRVNTIQIALQNFSNFIFDFGNLILNFRIEYYLCGEVNKTQGREPFREVSQGHHCLG